MPRCRSSCSCEHCCMHKQFFVASDVQGHPVVQGHAGEQLLHVSLESGAHPYDDQGHQHFGPSTRRSTSKAKLSVPESRMFCTIGEMQNCTFRPAIRPSSQVREPRSVDEMSTGDLLVKQNRLQQRLREKEDHERAMHPFKPTLYTPPKRFSDVKGKVAYDDPTFTARCTYKQIQKQVQAQIAENRRQVLIFQYLLGVCCWPKEDHTQTCSP
jgi:hypothetical protein